MVKTCFQALSAFKDLKVSKRINKYNEKDKGILDQDKKQTFKGNRSDRIFGISRSISTSKYNFYPLKPEEL